LISFAFTEEQEDFRRGLAQFARDVLRPGYRERAGKTEFPWDIQRRLGSMGVLGIGLPEEHGGSGVEDPILLGLATETLAEGDVNIAAAPVQVGLIGSQLARGSEAVRQQYLPPLIRGECTVAIALTEPGGGLPKAMELAEGIASNAPLTNFAVLQALPLIAEANPQTGLLMESLMATVAQSDKEAKRRIRAFLDRKTAKVKPS